MVGSFGAPAPASFSFRIEKDWSADHLFYAKALKQSKVDISQACQVDLQGKPGHCVVTVNSSAEREKILDAGIRISGKQVLCEISGVDLTHLHVFGCPVGLQNSILCAALGQFGRIVGSPQQKKVLHEGLEISTGTRVLSLVLRSPVPSTVTVGQLKLRVWHRSQQQTCLRCNNSGHEAKACPNRGAQSTAFRPPQTQHRNTTCTSTNPPRVSTATNTGTVTTQPAEAAAEPAVVSVETGEASNAGLNTASVNSYCQALLANGTSTGTTDTSNHVPAFSQPGDKEKSSETTPSPDEEGFRCAAGKHTFSATVLSGRTEPPASALNDPQIAWAKEYSSRERKKLAERVEAARRGSH